MATYAANKSLDFQSMAMASAAEVASTAHAEESWRTDPHWEPAANITEQLNRTDGEGAETYKAAKAEVDHMRDTGGSTSEESLGIGSTRRPENCRPTR